MYEIVEDSFNKNTVVGNGNGSVNVDIIGMGCVSFDNYKSIISERKLADEFIIQVRKSYDNILYNISLEEAHKRCERGKYKDDIPDEIAKRIKPVKDKLKKIETKDIELNGCIVADHKSIQNVSDFTSSLNHDGYTIIFGGIEIKFNKVKDNNFDFLDCVEEDDSKVFPTCQYCGNNREYETVYKFKINPRYRICEKCVTDIRGICAKISDNEEVKKDIVGDGLTN